MEPVTSSLHHPCNDYRPARVKKMFYVEETGGKPAQEDKSSKKSAFATDNGVKLHSAAQDHLRHRISSIQGSEFPPALYSGAKTRGFRRGFGQNSATYTAGLGMFFVFLGATLNSAKKNLG